jgi:hypothetical protein
MLLLLALSYLRNRNGGKLKSPTRKRDVDQNSFKARVAFHGDRLSFPGFGAN